MGEIEKSLYLSSDLTDRHEIWHIDTLSSLWLFPFLKFPYFEIKVGGGRHLEKSKNRHISATV